MICNNFFIAARPPLPPHPTVQFPAHVINTITSAWQHDPDSRPDFADILPNIEKFASPNSDPESSLMEVNRDSITSPSSVSALKSHWENKNAPNGWFFFSSFIRRKYFFPEKKYNETKNCELYKLLSQL